MALHCHADTLEHVRVWELAEELRVLPTDVLELIKPYDTYVTSHLATVPRQALDAIRAHPPEPVPGYYGLQDERRRRRLPRMLREAEDQATVARQHARPSRPRPGTPPRRRYRHRPGPKPVSYEPPYEDLDDDGYGVDPTRELQWEPVWSTRDVARYYGVKPATVRSWVTRGHLTPCGTDGPSHIFRRSDIRDAVTAIAGRRKRPAFPAKPSRQGDLDTQAQAASPLTRRRPTPHGIAHPSLQRLAAVTPNATVTTAEAAKLTGLAPATIRAWVHRGHLTPATRAPDQPAREQRYRLEDLQAATRRR